MGKVETMREKMPKVAVFIDAMREAFGRAEVDEMIRRGMAGEGGAWHFRAEENGHIVGVANQRERAR